MENLPELDNLLLQGAAKAKPVAKEVLSRVKKVLI
jgi:hypothetical protein